MMHYRWNLLALASLRDGLVARIWIRFLLYFKHKRVCIIRALTCTYQLYYLPFYCFSLSVGDVVLLRASAESLKLALLVWHLWSALCTAGDRG